MGYSPETVATFVSLDSKELEEYLTYYQKCLDNFKLSPGTREYFDNLYRHAVAVLLVRKHNPVARGRTGFDTPQYWVCKICGRNAVRPEKLLKWGCRT